MVAFIRFFEKILLPYYGFHRILLLFFLLSLLAIHLTLLSWMAKSDKILVYSGFTIAIPLFLALFLWVSQSPVFDSIQDSFMTVAYCMDIQWTENSAYESPSHGLEAKTVSSPQTFNTQSRSSGVQKKTSFFSKFYTPDERRYLNVLSRDGQNYYMNNTCPQQLLICNYRLLVITAVLVGAAVGFSVAAVPRVMTMLYMGKYPHYS